MRVEELTVEVRDENINRVGQILPVDLVGFKAVLRFNNVGTWEIDLPVGHPMGELLRLPGYGLIVTGPDGVILSGPTTSAENTKERGNPEGTWIITGSDDSIILGERLAYPTPSTADVTAQTQAYDSVYDETTSTAMYGYVERNLITGVAPTARAVTGLVLAADTSLGTTVTKSARFNVLGELLTELAVVDGLGFDIKQQDYDLVFSVYQPVDRSLEIRMDIANNTLSKTSYGYAAPGVTRAIVAGQGQAEDRTFVEVTTTDSTSAQALWARRIENFIDQRNTDVAEELTQAGLERLAEAGNTITSVDVVPSSDTTMRPFVDWNLGDRVGVVIGGQEVAAVVTQIAVTIESDGVRIGATVGEPTGVDYESLMAGRQQSTARKINALERKESASGGGGGGGTTYVGDTAPLVIDDWEYWFKSNTGELFFKYNDGNSIQWVSTNATSTDLALTGRVTTAETNITNLQSIAYTSVSGVPTSALTGKLSYSTLPAGTLVQVQHVQTSNWVGIAAQDISAISGLSLSFTPKFANSKILLQSMINSTNTYVATFGFLRNSTNVSGVNNTNSSGSVATQYWFDQSLNYMNNVYISYMEDASSTTARTYSAAVSSSWAGSVYTIQVNDRSDGSMRSVSTLTVMEIAQ